MSDAQPASPRNEDWLIECELQRLAGYLLLVAPQHAFLEPLARALVGDAASQPEALRARLAEESLRIEKQLAALVPKSLIARLIAYHRPSRIESDLLLFALLPELDDRFGDVFLALQPGLPLRRPTLGLALRALLADRGERWHVRRHLTRSPLWTAALLRHNAGEGPGLDVHLVPSAPVVAAAHGYVPDRLDGGAVIEAVDTAQAKGDLRPALAGLVDELSAWCELVQTGATHLIADSADDARAIAGAVARAFGRPLLVLSALGARPGEALLEAALAAIIASAPVLVELPRGAEPLAVPASWRPPLPFFFASPPSVELTLPPAVPARRILVPRARPLEQADAWQAALGEGHTSRLPLLANRTDLAISTIHRAAALARQRATLAGRGAPAHDDVVSALSEVVPDPVSSLARATRPSVPWSKLVLDRETQAALDALVVRVEHRLTVHGRWGLAGAEGRGDGLVALFHGESGTGKTLAAEAVASRLGVAMMRVDLSRVVSKYIGETEKNMSALFDAAEGFRTLLFFDEADALFGSRTGVKDAHDRWANLETNYLLFRLEAFEGMAILATNLFQNIDSAFARRLQFVVHFPRPAPPLQQKIWAAHLPEARRGADVDLAALARTHDLVGGEIRNAAVSAAYAAAAGGSPITQPMLEQAVREERLKRGKAVRRE
ncbi:ATP-binding protein [Sorangium sp. So ce1182]|uniref:ATP-binding protein n=1 Tax=Sorangium sp. So ce1182 TaxID=3133334 RepID=UPI003F5FA067